MIKRILGVVGVVFLLPVSLVFADSDVLGKQAEERTDWQRIFDTYEVAGTMVVLDAREQPAAVLVYNRERAVKRFSPASTYKIPHTLFALDAGVVSGKDEVFEWDGVERSFALHNQDQDLHSAMQNSAVWVYQILAERIGERAARQYLQQIEYGNADPSTAEGDYWIGGNLEISAYEQVAFLRKLYGNGLPFSDEHQQFVKGLMVSEAGDEWVLRAKTGWVGSSGALGWWVGWVEWPAGPVFFALNIDTPNGMDDLYKREAIARDVLHTVEEMTD